MEYSLDFYNGKRVLVTGHTGFKGTWLSRLLVYAGAKVTGYSLSSVGERNFYKMSHVDERIDSVIGDIRDFSRIKEVFQSARPEIVFHLAAQPIVLESYHEPRYTYETNVMGTVNVLECVRLNPCVKSVLNITTDKVYRNNEWMWGYRENDALDGYDPYSNSKSCSELVTHSYKNSFFCDNHVAVSTARAGNVIGGGDFADNRIIPDCVRAIEKGEPICVRNPHSTRPYQHVLEPLAVYLQIAASQYENAAFADCYNVGPDEQDCITTQRLAELFCKYWGEGASCKSRVEASALHEANYLKLDCSKIKSVFGWQPRWHIDECMQKVCELYRAIIAGNDVPQEMNKQIKDFFQ